MNRDIYDEIINGENTYREIANRLKHGQSVIIGWTDERSTHLDILFTYHIYKEYRNYLQRGLRGNELFVSIISIGAFGFNVNNNQKYPEYIKEKLNLTGEPTCEKLADLINGIIKELQNETI